MILDKENMLSYQQAITVTANSQNVIDLGPHAWWKAAGNDQPIPVILAIDEVFAAAGAATLRIQLQSATDEAVSANVRTHYDRTFSLAELIRSGRLDHGINLPPDVQRYVRATYTVGTGPMTAGKLTLGVAASRQTNF